MIRIAATLLALAAAWLPPGTSVAADGGPLTQEYFVRQGAEEPLVIRVNPFEGAFVARASGPDGRVLKSVGLGGNRVLPAFIFVEGASRERQLDIRIDAPWSTDHTRFELEFSRLDVRDESSARLAEGYRLLGYGYERLEVETAANWSVKVSMLLQAARVFEGFGMEELRWWASLAAAHVALFQLGEADLAQDLAGSALTAARVSGLGRVGLAAYLLQAEVALSMAREGRGGEDAWLKARELLRSAADVAAATGFPYEQAHAGFLGAQLLSEHGRHAEALGEYERALDVALGRGARVLATEIRERIVQAHDELGDIQAEEEVLGNIVTQLTEEGADSELVRGLLQQADLYLGLYRYPEAVEALNRALDLDRVSLTRAQAQLMLGAALYESGRFAEAEQRLREALINPDSGLFRRPSPLLPLADGLGLLANLHRASGEMAEAQRVRRVQSRHLVSPAERADWAYESLVDEIAAGQWSAARRLFTTHLEALEGAGLADLARLALCASPSLDCARPEVDRAFERARGRAGPRQAAMADWHRARWLAASGHADEAVRALGALLQVVHFYRQELPGVLGGWYWINRVALFGAALAWPDRLVQGAAAESLLGLARIRAIDRARPGAGSNDPLRTLVAAADGLPVALLDAQARFASEHSGLSAAGLATFLNRMGPGEGLLALDLRPGRARVWLAGRAGVRSRELPLSPELPRALRAAREGRGQAGEALQQIGRELIDPLLPELPPVVYYLPMGELQGVPLGAVPVGAQRLAQLRRLAVPGAIPGPAGSRGAPGSTPLVFVAGNPTDWTGEVPEGWQTTEEIRVLTGLFAGPGLHVVQGNALLPDEFQDDRLFGAGIVHLALPAVIDLGRPEASWIELSEPGRNQGRERISAAGITQWQLLQGAVVVLSQASQRGEPADRFASRMGLVDELLEAGAGAVVVGHGTDAGVGTARFAAAFYRALLESGDTMAAMASAQAALAPASDTQDSKGFGYQLFVR